MFPREGADPDWASAFAGEQDGRDIPYAVEPPLPNRHPSESWGIPLSAGRCSYSLGYPSFRWGDGLGLSETAVRHTFPSRLREGSGEGATYVLASGRWGTPLPQPLP